MPVQKHEQSRHEHDSRRRSQGSVPSGRRNLRQPRGSEGSIVSNGSNIKVKSSSRQHTDASLKPSKTVERDITEEVEKERELTDRHDDAIAHITNDVSGIDNKADTKTDDSEIKQVHDEPKETLSSPRHMVIPPTASGGSPPRKEPEKFTIEKFNRNMDDFVEVFTSDKYMHVTDDYPVNELVSVVSDVTTSVEEFKQQTVSSQRHLEDLRETMRRVKEKLQTNIQKKANVIRIDDQVQSIEERELTEKLAKLNAQVAQANAELADALRLSAETESTAVEAQLAAEKAKEEARNIQEEIAFRAKVEERRKAEEIRKMEEQKRRQEEQRRQEEEARRQKEAEWRRKEMGGEKTPSWEKWPAYEYKVQDQPVDLGCIIRAPPNKFDSNSVKCTALEQINCPVPFCENEELVSCIICLSPAREDFQLQEPIAVCIPFIAPRTSAHVHSSREPVIKIEQNGKWNCLETREENMETHKDYKFAIAEVRTLSKMAVFSRLKQDYATVSSRGGKVTSSYDSRISFTVPRNGIDGKDHVIMEVQPIDTTTVSDLRVRSPTCKGLLTSSPIIHMAWESTDFNKPVTVTVPCPPNPAKAKKIAAMRKAKEEKMRNPPRPQVILPHEQEAIEKEKQKSKLQKMQEELLQAEKEKDEPKQTKWYMGEYANNEDDENDNLFLVSGQGPDKWTPVPDVQVMQVKLDLLQFDLDKPLDKFMVLRTRTNVPEDNIGPIACEVSHFLSQKFVQVILKQKSDDPYDTVLSVIPAAKTEKTLKKLSEEGYDDGPEPSQVLSINEGDIIEVSFRGNVTKRDTEQIQFVYNSNLESETDFYACEVDKYLQKNFPVYRGVVEVYRKYEVTPKKKLRRKEQAFEECELPPEYKRDLICEMAINIPKYHVEPSSTLVKAPIIIRNTTDPINESLMRFVADELGDEWRIVANHLNLSKPRIQAILRNMQNNDLSDADAKYDMLMTWLKKTPKAVDKVSCLSMALLKSGRGDIAEDVKARNREFREHHRSH